MRLSKPVNRRHSSMNIIHVLGIIWASCLLLMLTLIFICKGLVWPGAIFCAMNVLFVAHRLGGCFIVCLAVTIPVNIPDFTGVPLSDAGSLSPAWVYVLRPSQETEMDVSGAVSPLLNCSSVGRP